MGTALVADTWNGTLKVDMFPKERKSTRTRSSSREAAVVGGGG